MTAAVFDQTLFRFRDDDGSESAATWRQALNTDDTQDTGTNYRIRFEVTETAGGKDNNLTLQLQYNRNSGGWNDANASSSVIQSSTSTHFTDGDDCTQQLGSSSFVNNNDAMDDVDGSSASRIGANQVLESEACYQIVDADVSDADTIELRLTGNGSAFSAYTQIPTITVNKPASGAVIFRRRRSGGNRYFH